MKKTEAVRPIAEWTPDKQNANPGTARGRAMLEHSVRRYGLGRSVLADKHGRIIGGNKTLEAARGAGVTETIVVPNDGSNLVVVQRMDLDLDVDVQAKELAIADNQTSAVGVNFHGGTLAELEAQGVDVRQFFRPAEYDKLTQAAAEERSPAEEIPEMQLQPFEHHDYIMVVFRDSHAWTRACDRLGIGQVGVSVAGRRKIGLGRVISGDALLEVLDATPKATPKKVKTK